MCSVVLPLDYFACNGVEKAWVSFPGGNGILIFNWVWTYLLGPEDGLLAWPGAAVFFFKALNPLVSRRSPLSVVV